MPRIGKSPGASALSVCQICLLLHIQISFLWENDVRTNVFSGLDAGCTSETLTAAAVPVMAGSALAVADLGTGFRAWPCVLCFLFAFIMQIDANFINDYFDFRKGSDRTDRLGPERACAQGWITPRAMLRGIGVTTVLACLAGLPLLWYAGWELVVVGSGVCRVRLSLHVGDFPIVGGATCWCWCFSDSCPSASPTTVQTGVWTWAALVLCLGLRAGHRHAALMVNNYRDRDQDRISGKRTVVVRWGAPTVERCVFVAGLFALSGLSVACGRRLSVGGHPAAILSHPSYPLLATDG